MLDATDRQILALLHSNAKMPYRDIGETVHLTGQAVSNRIARLEALGIIQRYTVVLDEAKLGNGVTALVTVFMKTTDHPAFRRFLQEQESVREAYRVSGDGCYQLKVVTSDPETLNRFLDQLLQYASYRLSISIDPIK